MGQFHRSARRDRKHTGRPDRSFRRRLLDRLDQAILSKAFRGELVSRDSADEPASVPLNRVKAESAAAPAGARRARKPRAE